MSSASAEIRIVYTALATLLRAPRNPKNHDHAALRTSMTRWGFTQPLALNEATGKLVEGHGRLDVLQALKAEGATPPTRITVKGDEWRKGLTLARSRKRTGCSTPRTTSPTSTHVGRCAC